MDSRYENESIAKKNYETAMGGSGENLKGVHMYKRPYLWRENNPAHPYADTPCENFVPTPTMNTGEDEITASPLKKAIKIALIVLFVGFMIYALVAQLIETPELFKLGETTVKQYR